MAEVELEEQKASDVCQLCGCLCQTCALSTGLAVRMTDREGNDLGAAVCGAQVDLAYGGAGECSGCHCKVDAIGNPIR